MGMRKRVGNGKSIHFFNDPWVPKEVSFKPLSLNRSIGQEEAMVSDFITPSNGCDIDKIRNVVVEEDALLINFIPISAANVEDTWIWHYSTNGEYSTKNGYN